MEVVILGCGTSSSVPSIKCLLSESPCKVCTGAHEDPTSKNRRLNPSILIRTPERKVIVIDAGKTFRESVLRWFPSLGISSIDAVLLTHDHADACLGVDDLRDLQKEGKIIKNVATGENMRIAAQPLPVYLSEKTLCEIGKKFDYLIPKAPKEKAACTEEKLETYRWKAEIDWKTIVDFQDIVIEGIHFKVLPVIHGANYYSYGFEFGWVHGFRFVYLSDVSEIPPETEKVLKERHYSHGRIDVLIIDSIYTSQVHGTHMNLPQAIAVVKKLQPKKTYLTGMGHDFDYDVTNGELQTLKHTDGVDIEMAYDGMRLEFEKQ